MACFDEVLVVDVVGEFRVLHEVEITDTEDGGDGPVPLGQFTVAEYQHWCTASNLSCFKFDSV